MASQVQVTNIAADQLRKQLSSMGVQLEAASTQINQQQIAMTALEEAKRQLQV